MSSSELKITYTPVHGVGHDYAKRAFEAFGLKPFIPVLEQVRYVCYNVCMLGDNFWEQKLV